MQQSAPSASSPTNTAALPTAPSLLASTSPQTPPFPPLASAYESAAAPKSPLRRLRLRACGRRAFRQRWALLFEFTARGRPSAAAGVGEKGERRIARWRMSCPQSRPMGQQLASALLSQWRQQREEKVATMITCTSLPVASISPTSPRGGALRAAAFPRTALLGPAPLSADATESTSTSPVRGRRVPSNRRFAVVEKYDGLRRRCLTQLF